MSDSVELVRDLLGGRWRAQALEVMIRLGIPEVLESAPGTASAIARHIGADPDGTARLLRLLAGLGLVSQAQDGAFMATEASRLLLDGHSRTQRRDALYTLSPSARIAWGALGHSVRTGECGFAAATGTMLPDHLSQHPDEADVVRLYRTGVARHNADALLSGCDLPPDAIVVVAGEHNAAALEPLTRKRPNLRIVTVDDRAQGPRLPAGDAYLLLHVLHDLSDAEAGRLIARFAAAMGAGSQLVVLAAVRSHGGLLPVYLDLQALLTCGGRERTVEEHRTLLEQAGLTLDSVALPEHRPGICVLTARRRYLGP